MRKHFSRIGITVILRTTFFLCVLTSMLGCGAITERISDRPITEEEARQQFYQDHRGDWVYEHGVGSNPEEAREQALANLARRVATQVRAETEHVIQQTEAADRVDQTETQEKMSSTTATLTRVSLEGTEFSDMVRVDTGWMAEIGISRENLEHAREQARLRSPLLARVETLNALPQDSAIDRARLALEGAYEAQQRDLEDDTVYDPESEATTTFQLHFEREIERALNRFKVLPVRISEEQGEILIIDSETYAPQSGVPLRMGEDTFETNERGSIGTLDLDKFQDGASLDLDLPIVKALDWDRAQPTDKAELRLDTLYPRDWEAQQTRLYIHTEPPGQPVVINEQRYETSPVAVIVDSPTGSIRTHETDMFSEERVEFSAAENSPAVHQSISLAERRFAKVSLSAEGKSRIELDGPENISHEHIDGTIESGKYQLTITHEDYNPEEPDYQVLKDEITLYEGQYLERSYQEPIYREPYHRGSGWSLSFLSLGAHGDEYPIAEVESLGDKYTVTASEFDDAENIDLHPYHLDLAADYRRFTDSIGPWMYQLGGGWRMSMYEDDRTVDDTDSFHAFYGRAGIGIWTDISDLPIWVGPSYTYEHISPPYDFSSFSHDYGYIEAGMLWGSLEIIARAPVSDEGIGPYMGIAFSFADFKRGYEYPETQEAMEGVHYEETQDRPQVSDR